ncbi:dienelactone hydrolase family protein [Lichenihabitans sp. Uapishka_5]|uniref:alpha/beta hydrolase n=1 Tax=Lichenihabitans sp. Uapishka_5 TaxID=3037302 RepID=UPI0029E7F578|nr:dienelactone hydrolase family protein [Lichenihabitans sp. Uapishka_5]MDX7952058.1 dienelactone hydrolase family protein [Lichenihabitans sp. Uapishka_5]
MAARIDGPRLPAKSRHARQLVVFLHGYGADGQDLIEIARQWQPWLPDAEFVAPHAPERCSQSPTGRQWFPLTFRDPNERWRGVVGAAPGLDGFLDAELERLGLDDGRLALVGFSQGTMMALHVGLRRRGRVAAILGYSGLLVAPQPETAADAGPSQQPPVLLVHGDADQVIPLDALFQSADALAEASVPCQWHLSLGVGHGIDPAGLRHGGLFLAKSFGLPFPMR